jgi:hypothetical protein
LKRGVEERDRERERERDSERKRGNVSFLIFITINIVQIFNTLMSDIYSSREI